MPRFLGVNKLFDDHHPHGSYWYLQILGVAPAWQGQGIGSALMAPVLECCHREGAGENVGATVDAGAADFFSSGTTGVLPGVRGPALLQDNPETGDQFGGALDVQALL